MNTRPDRFRVVVTHPAMERAFQRFAPSLPEAQRILEGHTKNMVGAHAQIIETREDVVYEVRT